MREDLKNDLDHFNVFQLKPYVEGPLKSIPYRRRDFFKVKAGQGGARVPYTASVFEVKKRLNQSSTQFRKGLLSLDLC
jgi:AraC family transcriptional regulator, transcriptional activator of pobA